MTQIRYRYVPPNRPYFTYRFKPQPPTPGAQRALEIYLASIARWLEERRRRLAGGQDNPTS